MPAAFWDTSTTELTLPHVPQCMNKTCLVNATVTGLNIHIWSVQWAYGQQPGNSQQQNCDPVVNQVYIDFFSHENI